MADEQKKIILSVGVDASEASHGVEELKKNLSSINNVDLTKSTTSLKRDLREAKELAQVAFKTFGESSAEFSTAAKRVAELKDNIEQVNNTVKNFNPDNKLQVLVSIGNTAATAFQGVAGAMAAFGVESESATKTMAKLQGIMALTNALGQFDNMRDNIKDFNRLISQSTVVQNINSAATATANGILGVFGITAETTATSFKVLRAALLGLGIAALVAGIYFLVTALKDMGDASDKMALKQRTLSEVSLKAADTYGQEKGKLDVLIATLKDEGISRQAKLDGLKELQKAFPGYFDNIKNEKDMTEKLAAAYQKATEGILAKAKAQAAGALLAETETAMMKKELELQDNISKANKLFNEQMTAPVTGTKNKAFYDQIKTSHNIAIKSISEDYADDIQDLKDKSKFLVDAVVKSNEEIEKAGGQVFAHDKTAKTKDTTADFEAFKKQLKEHLQELQRIREEAEKTSRDAQMTARERELNDINFHYKEESDKIQKDEDDTLALLKTEKKKKLITEDEYEKQVQLVTLRANEARVAIIEEKGNRRLEVEKKYADEISDFILSQEETTFDKQRRELDKKYKKLFDDAKTFHQKVLLALAKEKEDNNITTSETTHKQVVTTETTLANTQVDNDTKDTDSAATRIKKLNNVYKAEKSFKDAKFKEDLAKLGTDQDAINDLKAQKRKQDLDDEKANAAAKKQITEDEHQQKINTYHSIGDAAVALGDIIGKQTVASKALNIAAATMNTYVGISEIWRAKSTLPEPFGTAAKVASTVIAAASGFAAVKGILSTNVPGGGGSAGGAAAPSISTAPVINAAATAASTSSIQDVRVVNNQDKVIRTYITDRDLVTNQQKSNFLNRLSTI